MKSFALLSLLALGAALAPITLAARPAAALPSTVYMTLNNDHSSRVTCQAHRYANGTMGAALGLTVAEAKRKSSGAFTKPADSPMVRIRCTNAGGTVFDVKPFTFDTANYATHQINIGCVAGTLMCTASQGPIDKA